MKKGLGPGPFPLFVFGSQAHREFRALFPTLGVAISRLPGSEKHSKTSMVLTSNLGTSDVEATRKDLIAVGLSRAYLYLISRVGLCKIDSSKMHSKKSNNI